MLDGQPIAFQAPALRVLAYHKPVGLIATAQDPQGRPTIFRNLPSIPGLHSVGRLDLNSEGLLLLTNDGDLTLHLTHPRYGHRKRYVVHLEGGPITSTEAASLRRGVALDDGPARADEVNIHPKGCEVVLHEGRNRQVRRMLKAIGRDVLRLIRTEHGGVNLGMLPIGGWRDLTEAEIKALRYAPTQAASKTNRRAT
jgi:23S rRNA pseudouridine2605 synthase